jgi:lipoprotein-releasing system ATP-binding protein
MTEAALQAIAVCKSFRQGPELLQVLAGANLHIAPGERLAIVGASGSGKTTLLQILGGLDKPSSGQVLVAGRDIHQMDERERGLLRNRSLGFVYQFHHLLPEFSALENVAMPLLVRRTPVAEARGRAREILERVGLGQRLTHRPHQLSGGERQRAAVARALVTQPAVVLADEPTGNLDPRTAGQILALLRDQIKASAGAGILITHSRAAAETADRILVLDAAGLSPCSG